MRSFLGCLLNNKERGLIKKLGQMINICYRKIIWLYLSRKCMKRSIHSSVGKGVSLVGAEYMTIEEKFSAGKNLKLQTWKEYRGLPTGRIPSLIIRNNVTIMDNCQISCMDRIEIGSGSLLGDNVFVTDNFHGNNCISEMEMAPIERRLFSKGPVIIGRNVWIGRNVCIMPGVTVGDGVVIGANAVVTSDIPNNAIAVGCPAKVVKHINENDSSYE